MLLGFISLLLTVGQSPISNICIPKIVGATWHPCGKKQEEGKLSNEYSGKKDDSSSSAEDHGRKLLAAEGARRILAGAGTDKCAAKVYIILNFKYVHYYYSHVNTTHI